MSNVAVYPSVNKMTADSWRFRSVCEGDLDKFWTTSRFILKQLDYSLSISVRDSWHGLRLHQLSRVRNLELILI